MNEQHKGLPASSGIAIGPLWVYRPVEAKVERKTIVNIDTELERFNSALQEAAQQLKVLEEKARQEIGESEAEIFGAHQMFLEDPTLIDGITCMITDEALNAEAAVMDNVEALATELGAVDDEYFRARAADVLDVGKRVVNILSGLDVSVKGFPDHPVIILADDLTPSDTVQFDKDKILGLATIRGGPTSHTAILARSMGLPAVVSVSLGLDDLADGTEVILDGGRGMILSNPDEETRSQYIADQAELQSRRDQELAESNKSAITLDGHQVEIVANIGNVEDAKAAIDFGAEGVGLFRTEFLFLDRTTLPDEEDQTAAYKSVFEVMAGKPVVVRTLDIGGDKAVPYLGFKDEANPFLGWRAIRMLDEHENVLFTQFRALLRAGVDTDLRIMVPMVSRLTEVELAKTLLKRAQESLEKEGVPYCQSVQFGIMIEVPSAVMVIDHIAPLVDFFSIGTNDLTQYTMAVDRTNERVAAIATPFHPSVLRLIKKTIKAAHKQGKWVGLCGEFASHPAAAPLLLGLGLDEFSMSSSSIPEIKALLRKLSKKDCKKIAKQAIRLPKSEAVQTYLQSVIDNIVNA